VRRLAQAQLDPAHLPAELPDSREAMGRLASLDQPTRVALHLIATALAQLPGDGQEPPGDPLWIRARVPHVLDRSVVASRDRHHPRLAGPELTTADTTLDRIDLFGALESGHHPSFDCVLVDAPRRRP